MTTAAHERLAALGVRLPVPPSPVASYVPAVVSGGHLYVSGQLPFVDGVLPATGLVGGEVDPDVAHGLARVCAVNVLAVAEAAVGLGAVARVVKLVGFVACVPGFTGHPGVVNGASDLMADVFGDRGRHARSAVGVASLPLGAPVEVEAVLALAEA